MKPIRVLAYQVVLVYRNARLARVLTEGVHWIGLKSQIEKYNMAKPFPVLSNLNALLEHDTFRAMVDTVEVRDSEIVIQEKDGNYDTILVPGRYVYWKSGLHKYARMTYDVSQLEVPDTVSKSLVKTGALTRYVSQVTVDAGECGLLYVDGVYLRTLDPGTYYFWRNEKSVAVTKADLRIQQMDIPGQEILTRDKAAIRINVQAQYKVRDVVKALVETKEYTKQVYVLLQLSLRAYCGSLTLDEILSRKDDVQTMILTDTSAKTAAIGVDLISCGIRDIILPGDVKDIMNQVLIAEKKAQANAITRREETASTRSLLNTARLLEENAMLYKLKEMEHVEKIAEKINEISLSGGTQIVDQLRQIFVKE